MSCGSRVCFVLGPGCGRAGHNILLNAKSVMERVFRPERLDTDPASSSASKDWIHWKRTFNNFLESFAAPGPDKLKTLTNYVSPTVFGFIIDCDTFNDAMQVLENIYIKPKNELFARFVLSTRRQEGNESLDQFAQALHSLAKDCKFEPVSADKYREECIRDAFISGISSTDIRKRLLENNTLTLTEALSKARALDLAQRNSEFYFQNALGVGAAAAQSFQREGASQVLEASATTSAVVSNRQSRKSCFSCGGPFPHRGLCPAKDVRCNHCRKLGHFAKVCKSSDIRPSKRMAATDLVSPEETCTSTSGNISWISALTTAATTSPVKSTTLVSIKNTSMIALVDSGSTDSFIRADLVSQLKLKVHSSSDQVYMASSALWVSVTGYCYANIEIGISSYDAVRFLVLPDLCSDIILGQDFMRLHKEVVFTYSGTRPSLKVCGVAKATIAPPRLFAGVPSNCTPIATKSRRYSSDDQKFIESEISRMLIEGIIKRSTSAWRAQVVVVTPESHKKRLVVDYSQTINKYTPLDAYPLPRIHDLAETVAKYRLFSTLDLTSAYHQIPLLEEESDKTAFEANGELFQFCRLPFGLTNAVANFQRIMNDFIRQNDLVGTFVYLDNILVCGMEDEDHDDNLRRFRAAAKRYNFTFNDSKCLFKQTSIDFLGYTISEGTLQPDAERLRPLREYPVPCDAKSLSRAVGLLSYYSQWIPRFSDKIRPLASSSSFPLGQEAVAAFRDLKIEIEKAMLLSIDESKSFVVETDASDFCLAATLNQSGRPVAFFSRTLSKSERLHSSVEKEAAAIVEALRRWRHYLTGRHFTLVTDQKSVSFMFDRTNYGKIKNDKILRWRLELACYHYDIVYRPGKDNVPADAISRACAMNSDLGKLRELHERLCHPGERRLLHFVRSKNLAYSLQDIKRVISSCSPCAELKPRFFRPPEGHHLIKATQPFERLSVDFKGPIVSSSKNRYVLTVVDEYSRFPFAFPCADMTVATVIKCLSTLFSVFGMPSYIHSDRGAQFMSADLRSFLTSRGVATSRTSPYRPQGNGQCERYNGIIWKAVLLGLKSRQLDERHWETVLPDALHSIRSLLSVATNCTPHERLFAYDRRSSSGSALPSWLVEPGPVLLRRHVRNKAGPLVEEVDLLEANPCYAHVRFRSGREDTVSLRDLAPVATTKVDNSSSSDSVLVEMAPETNIPVEDQISAEDDAPMEARQEDSIPPLRRSTREKRVPDRYT